MKTKIFAIYDSAVKAYMQPFFTQTVGLALRSFTELANDPGTMVCKHSPDFTLFELGSYDEIAGNFENLATPHAIATALSVKKSSLPETLPDFTHIADTEPVARARAATLRHSERTLNQ